MFKFFCNYEAGRSSLLDSLENYFVIGAMRLLVCYQQVAPIDQTCHSVFLGRSFANGIKAAYLGKLLAGSWI